MVLPLCVLTHAAIDGGSGNSFGLPETFQELTSTLTEADCAFLRHWLGLLELERRAAEVPQSNIWAAEPPLAPEAGNTSQVKAHPLSGRCIGHLRLLSYEGELPDLTFYRFQYTFSQACLTDSKASSPAHPTTGPCIASSAAGHLNDSPAESAMLGCDRSVRSDQGAACKASVLGLDEQGFGKGDACVLGCDRSVRSDQGAACKASVLGLDEQGFGKGDACVLSIQDAHPAVNRARVVDVTPSTLTLACRSRMPSFEQSCNLRKHASCHNDDQLAKLVTSTLQVPPLKCSQRVLRDPSSRDLSSKPSRCCSDNTHISWQSQHVPGSLTRDAAKPNCADVIAPQQQDPHATHLAYAGPERQERSSVGVLRWRVDKDEGETAMQCAIAGLLELVGGSSALLARLRGLIVHLKPPQRGARDAYATEVPEEEDCFEQMQAAECALVLVLHLLLSSAL
jgi:hypothetical protein